MLFSIVGQEANGTVHTKKWGLQGWIFGAKKLPPFVNGVVSSGGIQGPTPLFLDTCKRFYFFHDVFCYGGFTPPLTHPVRVKLRNSRHAVGRGSDCRGRKRHPRLRGIVPEPTPCRAEPSGAGTLWRRPFCQQYLLGQGSHNFDSGT